MSSPSLPRQRRGCDFGGGASGWTSLFHLLITIVLLTFVYLVIWQSKLDILVEKLLNRGWTPYAALGLTCWSFSILGEKVWKTLRRQKALEAGLIPMDVRLDTEEGIDACISRLEEGSERGDDAGLADRILAALEYFRNARSAALLTNFLEAESEEDMRALDSSYQMVRSFLWAIPILGFVGTVSGIGMAVDGFAGVLGTPQTGALRAEEQLAELKGALSGVTLNLAVAFDTTLVALILSILVMVAMTTAENLETGLLRRFDTSCRRELLHRIPGALDGSPRWEGAGATAEGSRETAGGTYPGTLPSDEPYLEDPAR